MNNNYLLLLISSLFAASGQLLLKIGANVGGWQILTSVKFWLGVFCYFAGAALWVYVLSKVALNEAYPFAALTFILVFLLSFFILGEPFSLVKGVGLGLVCTGFVVLCFAK